LPHLGEHDKPDRKAKMNVKFYDFKTKKVTEMPEDELAPGCVKIKIVGLEGEYFTNNVPNSKNDPLKHPAFTGELKEQVERIEQVFQEVYPQSFPDWEKGFRQDQNPEKEIALWLLMAEHYLYHTQERDLPIAAKKDYFAVILQAVTSGENHVRHLVNSTRCRETR
jgi:hypothetical protein